MNAIEFLNGSPIVTAIGWGLLHSLWQILVLAGFVKVAIRLCRHSAVAAFRIAMVGLTGSVVVAAVTTASVYRLHRSNAPPTLADAANIAHPTRQTVTPDSGDSGNVALTNQSTGASVPTVVPHPAARLSLSETPKAGPGLAVWTDRLNHIAPWLTICWLPGLLIFLSRPFLGVTHVLRLRRTARDVSRELRQRLARLAASIAIRRSICIAESALVRVPTVIGLFRPMILLPASVVTGLAAVELDAILLHELAHIRRRDTFWIVFQRLAETLFFFHPTIWWMSSVVDAEREHCCDDLATSAAGARTPLAEALLKLARGASQNSLALTATGGSLADRVRRLLADEPKPRRSGSLVAAGMIGLTIVGLCLGGLLSPALATDFTAAPGNAAETPDVPSEPASTEPEQMMAHYFSSAADLGAIDAEVKVLVHENPNQWALDDSTLRELSNRFRRLEVLVLPYCRSLTSAGVRHLAKLKRLKVLRLAFGEKLGAGAAKQIASLRKLEALDISYCRRLTVDDSVRQLLSIPTLQSLIVTRHTANGVTRSILDTVESRRTFRRIYVTPGTPLARELGSDPHPQVELIKDRPAVAVATFEKLLEPYSITFRKPDPQLGDAPGLPLAAAVQAFNRRYYNVQFDRLFQPVTVGEVIAGLKNAARNRQGSSITDAEFAQLQRIVQTRRIPDGFTLEALKGFIPNDFTRSTSASVRLRIQRRDGKSISFPICEFTRALTAERPWTITGRVTDKDGMAMSDIEVVALTEIALLEKSLILRETGSAKTNEHGEYRIPFGLTDDESRQLLSHADQRVTPADAKHVRRFTTIFAKRDGYFTRDLGAVVRGGTRKTLDLTMLPTTRIRGRIFRDTGQRINKMRVRLAGLPAHPAIHAVNRVNTDDRGRFELINVPTGFSYQIVVSSAKNGRPIGWATPKLPVVAGNSTNTHLLYWPEGRQTDFSFRHLHLVLQDDGEPVARALASAAARQLKLRFDGLASAGIVSANQASLEIGKRPAR